MQYICYKGHEFDEPKELKNMGGDIGESVYVCPVCGTDAYEELVECAVCGDMVRESESVEAVCENCLKANAGKKHAYELGKDCSEFLQLNGFLRYLFPDDEEIERILMEQASIREQRIWGYSLDEKGKQFCMDDTYCFAEYLKKRGAYL